MANKELTAKRNSKHEFVRIDDAPLLPPPATEAGITGWLWQNIFSSMADFSSIGTSFRSICVAALSVFLLYFGFGQIFTLLDLSLIHI